MDIKKIISLGECGYIEYKRQWYWDLTGEPKSDEFQVCWGEFIKDFLALVNANKGSFNQKRYLVIGFDEENKKIHNFDLTEGEFNRIKRKAKEKIKQFISDSSHIKYSIKMENENGINIISISIEPPTRIHFLSKNIKTKTIEYSSDSVLCRKNNTPNKEDKVGIMPKDQIVALEEKFNNLQNKEKTKIKRKKSIRFTIDAYLEGNKSYLLSKGFPEISDDSERYYEFYELNSKVDDNKTYFLYISDNKMEDTVKKFSEDFKDYTKFNLIVLINKPTGRTQLKNRKGNFETYFRKYGLNKFRIEFIDEFGKEYLYKEYLEPFLFKDEFNNTSNFIDNNVIDNKSNNESKASRVIIDWFEEEDSPIIVLTGMGGVGKTTLTKYFLNKTLKNKEQDDNYILFLDSSTLIDKLKSTTVNSIYDLYKADYDESKQFTEQLFKLSIDNGSFVIVLDGLDEIISRMKDNFQLDYFLHKIQEEYCFNSAKAKIIITCRDSIWEESLAQSEQIKHLDIRDIRLQPFNEKQAKDFFKSCFKNSKSLQNKAFSLVQKLIGESDDKAYSPFILDTISSIISDREEINIEELFSQEKSGMHALCLSTSSQTDYLIYAVCKREAKKLTIPFNSQIKLLCHMCKDNGLNNVDFIGLVENILGRKPSEQDLSLLKAHPFICENSGKINLRYDFLREFFTVILIAQKLTEENSILDSKEFLLLDKKVVYLNHFSKEVAKRTVSHDISSVCLNVIDNIEKIASSGEKNFDRFISSLFLIYLAVLNQNKKLDNKENLQNALIEIFGSSSSKIVKNLCLCNINNPNGKPKLVFDFSNLKFENCYIKNYSEFYNCIFNENTFFESGEIDLVKKPTIRFHHGLKKSNFSEKVVLLGETPNILEDIDNIHDELEKDNENDFKNFIRKFYLNGRFKSKKVSEIKAKQGNLVPKMRKIGVIVENKESRINED